ncbi:MAG: FAD-binding protein [Verrucomicrobia bacterium]|nr:FAD-binding protein [Verrucomicrobiota bacterium]
MPSIDMALSTNHLEKLKGLVGNENVLTKTEDLIAYSYDGTAAIQQTPAAVVFALTTRHVSEIIKWAKATETPIVTRGSGTGLSGGSIPSTGSVVLCLAKMDKIIEVDKDNLSILAEAGVTTQDIADAAASVDLFYPPDPGSNKISTIGGNVAENSGGLRGLKYGVTKNYVMGLELVLPDGELVWIGNKCVKDVAGYSMKDIFIGSEGTLGVITRALLRLIPKPAAKRTMLATFPKTEQAAEAVSAIIAARIIPCTLEFLDRTTIHCVEEYAKIGLPLDCEALLLMETDGHAAVVEEEATRMAEICRTQGATDVTIASDLQQADRLAAARRTAFSALARVMPTTILEDVTVPRNSLADMITFIQNTGEKYNLRIGTFGHMGDGNLHPTVLTNERNKPEMETVEKAFNEIFDEAIRLGGTITGEHGVGLAKKAQLPRFAGDQQMRLMRQFKNVIDPNNLLNPGKMFD